MAATEANIASTQFLSNRHKSRTCKTSTSMSPSATPATQMERQRHQMPHLPRKMARRLGRLTAPKRATRASPVPQVPRLPRKWKVNVTKCHACHANGTSMSPSATPAMQRWCVTMSCERGWEMVCERVCERWCVKECVAEWWKIVCERQCVTKWWKMVCDKVVCERGVCDKVVCDRVRAAVGTRSGIQNQKEEPHTKMWKKMISHPHGPRRWAYSVIWNGLSIASPSHGFLNVP